MNDNQLQRVAEDLMAIDGRVRERIDSLIDNQMGQWADGGGDPRVVEVLGAYRTMALNGGKRLRPAFAYWAFEGAGGDTATPAILDVATAVELLHTFALIHDDVMDEAETRRGIETIHVTYASHHRSAAMRGDAGHYGESIAILMGDLAFAHAALLMTRVPPACAEIFYEMCADLMVGQYLDIEASAQGPTPGALIAEQITELKTARYTVEGPMLLGAAAAGKADELRPHITAYGRPIGHAFQLRDDLLGTFGNPELTGKPVGDDLAQGKVTRLLELGLARSDAAHHALLERLGSPAMEPGDVQRALEILEETGARQEVERSIDGLVAEATAAIEAAPLAQDIREILVGAAHLIAYREK
jgi:geranylgeranyl diphosphate synthase type I